jgi:hypothetical protein
MPLDLNPPTQDLGIPKDRALPDKQWAHTRPVPMPLDLSQLNEPHQIVDLQNTGNQTHIIFNRVHQPIELRGGETRRGVDMLVKDILFFMDLRRPGQLDILGYPRPLHPVVIHEVPDPGAGQPQHAEPLPSGQSPPPDQASPQKFTGNIKR